MLQMFVRLIQAVFKGKDSIIYVCYNAQLEWMNAGNVSVRQRAGVLLPFHDCLHRVWLVAVFFQTDSQRLV